MFRKFAALGASARTFVYAHGKKTDLKSAAIIPPATPGSVGDAAMISVAIAELRQRGFGRIDLLYGKNWPVDGKIDRAIPAESFFYSGRVSQGQLLQKLMAQYDFVCFIGADVIDGAYNPGSVSRRLQLLNAASDRGASTTVLGASYNEKPEATTRAALQELPDSTQISARDPVAHRRLCASLDRTVVQTADLAFLLAPRNEDPEARRVISWIKGQKEAGKRVLAINANYLHAAANPSFGDSLTDFLHRLESHGVAILLVPHDTRTDFNDRQVLETASRKLDHRTLEIVRTVSPGAIKAILSNVDALFTGRLHAMILAMGAGTPAGGLAYQGKFEGMLQLFGLDDSNLLMSPGDFASDPKGAANLAFSILDRSVELRERIVERLPQVLTLSSKNFAKAE